MALRGVMISATTPEIHADQGGGQTVKRKGKGSLRRGKSECFDVVRQKSQLKAVAGHKHGDGDISPDEVER